MISPVTGDIAFSDGLCFGPQRSFPAKYLQNPPKPPQRIPLIKWTQYFLGAHPSEYGEFEVEVVCDHTHRIQAAFLAHAHPFYEPNTLEDAERRVYHESILNKDLLGQHEFSWGHAFSRLDAGQNKDWLTVVYSVGPLIPLHVREALRQLTAALPEPTSMIEKILRKFDEAREEE